jgi:hypothetical protein
MKFSCILLLSLILGQLCFAQEALIPKAQKISLIFVGAQKGLSESSFGHVSLRLSPDKQPGLLDIVVEFVADIPENHRGIKKYLKGAGILKRYPVAAVTSSFYDFRKQKTINENRDVAVYELDLSEEEVKSVTDFILNFQNDDTPEKYTFLSKNCSYFAALGIEKAVEKRLKSKSRPWKVAGVLKKEGLVLKEDFYPKATEERERYAQKFLEENPGIMPASWSSSFVKSLGEKIYIFRQASYFKLLSLASRGDEGVRRKVQALIRYLMPFETEVGQFTVKNLFHDLRYKKVIELEALVLGERAPKLPKKKKKVDHEIVVVKNSPYIKVAWRGKYDDTQNSTKAKVLIPLQNVGYDESRRMLLYKSQNVGRDLNLKSGEFVLSQRLDYALDTDEKGEVLRSFLYVDLSPEVKVPKLNLDELKEASHISLNNVRDFKGEIGSCYSMALIQKAFFERAIFLPEGKRPVADYDKIEVLKSLALGNYVVIPGYKNIMDFTKTIPLENFKGFIAAYQESLKKGAISQMIDNVKKRAILDEKSLPTLRALLDEGLTAPLIIGMTEKGKNKLASQTAHVILLHDLEPLKEGGYRVTAYDPNAGINTLFTLDKDFRLLYPFYDKAYDYRGMIDGISASQVALDHAVRSRKIDIGKLLFETKNGMPMILEPLEVSRILK